MTELKIGNFNLSLNSVNQTIDLKKLIKTFPIDIYLNNNQTILIQDDEAVSQSFIDICKPHRKENIKRPIGFTRIQYSQHLRRTQTTLAGNLLRSLITRPPVGPIPMGAWCNSCLSVGPRFHKETCSEPFNESLRISLYGFVSCILQTKKRKKYNEAVIEFKNKYEEAIKHFLMRQQSQGNPIEDLTKEQYIDIFLQLANEDPKINRTIDDAIESVWPALKFEYYDIVSDTGPKSSKKKSFFSNCAILSYNFETEDSTSVRVYDKGLVFIVSCPWKYKDFFEHVINRINETGTVTDKETQEQMEYEIGDTQVKSVFSIFHLFENSQTINLGELYNFLWPTDDSQIPLVKPPREVFIKKYTYSQKEVEHSYLKEGDEYYRYTIEYRSELNTPKIIMKMLPCVLNSEGTPEYCKPYKITVMIFKGGAIEMIFSFCDNEDPLCDERYLNLTLSEQYQEIEEELYKLQSFLIKLINQVSVFEDNTKESKEILNTVSGISPYKKPDSYKVGQDVDIFDHDTMTFEKEGKIEAATPNKVYTVDDEQYTTKDIRPHNPRSVMQLARSKISGTDIENTPEPYSFTGECKGGKQFFVPFGGTQARDNLYYPKCDKFTSTKKNIYINHILNGFPGDQEDEEKYLIEPSDDYDFYSGIFRKGTTNYNNRVRVKLPEEEDLMTELTQDQIDNFKEREDEEGFVWGTIINKKKTTNKGLDNYIVYTVDISYPDEETEPMRDYFHVSGKDFHPDYREDRRWGGINGNKKERLLYCAQRLGLSQSPFTTQRLDRELQSRVLESFSELGIKPRNTIVLTPTTFNKFTKYAYISLAFPKSAKRCMLYSNGDGCFFIDDKNSVIKIPTRESIAETCILDGYLALNTNTKIMEYYPVDCLYYNKKLKMDYLRDYQSGDSLEESDMENIEFGRLMHVKYISPLLDKIIITPRKYKIMDTLIAPFMDIDNPWESVSNNNLILDTKEIINNNVDLVFIPQKGGASYMRWKHILKTPIVLEKIKKVLLKNKKGESKIERWKVGLDGETIYGIGDTLISLPKHLSKEKFLRFNLNFMSNGDINPEEPILLTIDPVASEEDTYSKQHTELIIKAMMNPINERVFKETTGEWRIIKNGVVVSYEAQDEDSGVLPLTSLS